VAVLREALGTHAVIVTPGIRAAGADTEDQARTADPATAMRLGSNYLVVGRPILRAPDPVKAAQDIVRQIGAAFHVA
jgi:orotidine-5'-phosphate decarboxylase